MGYTTKFYGRFDLDKELTESQAAQLREFSKRDHHQHGEHTYGLAWGFWCDWVPTKDRKGIEWNGAEKFYSYTDWLEILNRVFFVPWGIKMSGKVEYQGEDRDDRGWVVFDGAKAMKRAGRFVMEGE